MPKTLVRKSASRNKSVASQKARNEAAISLLNKWLADESGYDERVWPRLKKAIEENRLSSRKRFDD
jgi:hypothetical protein